MPDLFPLLPFLFIGWCVICGVAFVAWITLSVYWMVRTDNAEEERRDREDREVQLLEQIPVPGRWQTVFPDAGDMSTSDGLGGYFPGDSPGMG